MSSDSTGFAVDPLIPSVESLLQGRAGREMFLTIVSVFATTRYGYLAAEYKKLSPKYGVDNAILSINQT
ncbi:hypothetical protein [Burkholderia sp. Bp8963]|uniref:hypothetical protein n=1 Tax=Burkholderia sp. Bp8963 TaxID=2184547 RepID=UPI000F59255C|nr:hypothetical protein [Burkholderia sp. Bp8963]